MDQLILLPSILLHENNQLVQDDLAALSWQCGSSFTSGVGGGGRSSFCGSRVTFTANGTFYVCVQNDGMSDQQSQGQRAAVGPRPSSAQLNKERHERIHLLKEKQDHDRLKKLEELKEQAFAAGRLREEQDSRRKKHFEELVKKEDERRKQAEERRRMLDEERKLAMQAKWESKSTKPSPRAQSASAKPAFAFGSCTPRLIDNHVDGCLWKSQYNLNVTREPGIRATSATDLHLNQQNQFRMSTSYSWNQQQTTLDKPLVHHKNDSSADRRLTKSRSNYDGADAMRVFCGRRRTDLTPTIPIKRDAYDMSASIRSTSGRGSGRVYSSISMTRLDRSRSPGCGNLSVAQHQHQGQRPSRSKSTHCLSSTGLKLTRTEILRQALAAKKDANGFRSVDQTRPPSSMSSSIMTSSTHSQVSTQWVPMRPRNMSRKSRPTSVHVTGVSQENNTNGDTNGSNKTIQHPRKRIDTSQERKSNSGTPIAPTKKIEPKKLSVPPIQPGETGTIKRPVKKSSSAPKDKPAAAAAVVKDAKNSSEKQSSQIKTEEDDSSTVDVASPVPPQKPEELNNSLSSPFESESVHTNVNVSLEKQFNNLNQSELVTSKAENVEINNTKNESNVSVGGNLKVIENLESLESAFASGSDYSSIRTPEPSAPKLMLMNDEVEGHVEKVSSSALDDLLGSELDFSNANPTDVSNNLLVPESHQALNGFQEVEKSGSPAPPDTLGTDDGKPKIMTEEQAKAAIAEKRKLAREAAEREAARLVDQQRLEEERQRLENAREVEEADRIAWEARAAEEERLRLAIEEQQKKEAEEKIRREEDEQARVEKEKQDREAAREAERVRLEMEERLKREEEERLERRKRVEAIMARTRKKEAEQQAKSNSSESRQGTEPVNGHKENNVLIGDNNVQSSNNSLNNNYNNNNDFGNNSTLIEFDGMGVQQSTNLLGDSNTGLISNNSSASNPLINNPLQDLLS